MDFTFYVRPHGRPRAETIDMDDDTERLAAELVAAGCRFESELIPGLGRADMASLDCQDSEGNQIAMQLVKNDPDTIRPAVTELVADAHARFTAGNYAKED